MQEPGFKRDQRQEEGWRACHASRLTFALTHACAPPSYVTLSRRDEHPTGMMCNGALMSRPLSALKDALAAVLLFLGGVLPPHIAYSPGQQHVAHDWLWSVGAHPLSATSTGEGKMGGRWGEGGEQGGRMLVCIILHNWLWSVGANLLSATSTGEGERGGGS